MMARPGHLGNPHLRVENRIMEEKPEKPKRPTFEPKKNSFGPPPKNGKGPNGKGFGGPPKGRSRGPGRGR